MLSVVADRAEAPSYRCWVGRIAGDASQVAYAQAFQLCFQIPHGVGELGKNNYFPVWVAFSDELLKGFQLGVLDWIPLPVFPQQGDQRISVVLELGLQVGPEQVMPHPGKAAPVPGGVFLVDTCCALLERFWRPVGCVLGVGRISFSFLFVIVFWVCGRSLRFVYILVSETGVEHFSVLGADRKRQFIAECVQEDVVAECVPFYGLDKSGAAAFQPFEQVRAAEAH